MQVKVERRAGLSQSAYCIPDTYRKPDDEKGGGNDDDSDHYVGSWPWLVWCDQHRRLR